MSYVSPKETIRLARDFPIDDVVKKYAADADIKVNVAREHERELKRFLALCALNPQAGYELRGPVDDLWHAFITDTMKYSAFCGRVAGRFIHHFPYYPGREKVGEGTYPKLLSDYKATFKERPPIHIWPPPNSPEDDRAGALGCAVRCACKPG
jgi:hypothetical protein